MILLFSAADNTVAKEVCEILSRNNFGYINKNIMCCHKNNIDTVVCTNRFKNLSVNSEIAVFTDTSDKYTVTELSKTAMLIVESTNTPIIKQALNRKNTVINFGYCKTDTVTISGTGKNSITVSLQRAIRNIYGIIIEPADYPITLSKPFSVPSVLIAATLLIIYGINPAEF